MMAARAHYASQIHHLILGLHGKHKTRPICFNNYRYLETGEKKKFIGTKFLIKSIVEQITSWGEDKWRFIATHVDLPDFATKLVCFLFGNVTKCDGVICFPFLVVSA